MSKWRERFKVHPAADVFPMMSDEELAALGEDIEKNGMREPIKLLRVKGETVGDTMTRIVLDGRNRLEAMERRGIDITSCAVKWSFANSIEDNDFDAAACIIAANIRRRHLTEQQQADLIVAAVKAGADLDGHERRRRTG